MGVNLKSVLKDLTGKTFGRLTVLARAENNGRVVMWSCYCACGNKTTVRGINLKCGTTKSCGCLQKESITKLGMSSTKIYGVWSSMKARCDNPNGMGYKNYGGRGISYEKSWETFTGFYKDMFKGYEEGLTLERIDVNGDYCRNNCTWIPRENQSRNLRKFCTNTSGKTGVANNRLKGEVKYYTAYWYEGGKRKSKNFSIKKLGKEEAFRLACEYRDEQIRLLNERGAGYSEGHGDQ